MLGQTAGSWDFALTYPTWILWSRETKMVGRFSRRSDDCSTVDCRARSFPPPSQHDPYWTRALVWKLWSSSLCWTLHLSWSSSRSHRDLGHRAPSSSSTTQGWGPCRQQPSHSETETTLREIINLTACGKGNLSKPRRLWIWPLNMGRKNKLPQWYHLHGAQLANEPPIKPTCVLSRNLKWHCSRKVIDDSKYIDDSLKAKAYDFHLKRLQYWN